MISNQKTIDNKRIAKNTVFLYLRQLITMAVSLYTVRVILDVLGTEDYGIYNVVGGVVVMFGFFSTTMSTATQRFLAFEIGKGKNGELQKVFSISVKLYVYILLLTVLLAETIGLYFVNSKMVIPSDRIVAANYVFQSTIFSFCITLLCIPYNAAIIAKEKMNVFAYCSILEASLSLLVAISLSYFLYDHLIVYSIMMILRILIVEIVYVLYCKRNFDFCSYVKVTDNKLLKEILTFAGWNMLGSLANILRSQGLNILLNIFFNPVINAARGIAYQINSAVNQLTTNFYSAVRPQLIKSYASNNCNEMLSLGIKSSRYAYYLSLLVAIPLILETYGILSLWLKEVPVYSVIFVQITIVQSVIEVLMMPIGNMLQAANQIKMHQIIISILYLLNIPISYFLLKFGYPPTIVFWVNLVLVTLSYVPRLIILKNVFHIYIWTYIKEVFGIIIRPTILVIIWGAIYKQYRLGVSIEFFNVFLHILIVAISVSFLGFSKEERSLIINKAIKKFNLCREKI